MKNKIEGWFPILGSLVVVIIFLSFNLLQVESPVPKYWKEIILAATTTSAIILGFLLLGLCILFVRMRGYVISGLGVKYNRLISYFLDAVNWLSIAILLNFCCQVFDIRYWFRHLQILAISSWLFVVLTSALSTYRIIYLFAIILRQSAKEE